MMTPVDARCRRLLKTRPCLDIGRDRTKSFSIQTQILFTRSLKAILECESKAEAMRTKLNEKCEKIESGFTRFDTSKTGKINDEKLIKLLNHIGFQLKDKDLELVLNRFNRDGDGLITKEEFLKELRPKLRINTNK